MRFSFLVYAARSGSTFLARQLSSATADLIVLPEFRLPYFLLIRSEANVRALGSEGLHTLMGLDPQMPDSLGLSREALGRIAAVSAEGTRSILECVTKEFAAAHGVSSGHTLIKLGGALAFRDRISALFPQARYVHLLRDGRGVVASLLNTEKAYFPGEDMGRGDVVHCAKGWNRHLNQVRRAEEEGAPILTVRYEDLSADPAPVVAAVLDFLEAKPAAGSHRPSYYRVSEAERGLHRNVDGPALAQRARAWESSLAPWQGIAAEWWTRRSLGRHGYAPWFRAKVAGYRQVAAVCRAWLVHLWTTLRYLVRRIALLPRQPRRFFELLEVRRRRWHG